MTTSIDRRSFATGRALASTTLATHTAAAATASAATGAFDDAALEAPANLHRVHRRLRVAADERVVFWWMKGRRCERPGFVPATVHFNDYNGWSPRFQMGDAPGASVSRCSGRKVARVEELPASFLAIARRVHAAARADPARTLG